MKRLSGRPVTKLLFSIAIAALAFASTSQAETPWTVKPEWVAAHEAFLASDAANGRGSATHDEAVAAAHVASEFQGYGLNTAPGMDSYLQHATIVKLRFAGTPTATISGRTVGEADGLHVLTSPGLVVTVPDLGNAPAQIWMRAAGSKGVKLLILRESDQTDELWGRLNKARACRPNSRTRTRRKNPARPLSYWRRPPSTH
jgi:hypothetical protein